MRDGRPVRGIVQMLMLVASLLSGLPLAAATSERTPAAGAALVKPDATVAKGGGAPDLVALARFQRGFAAPGSQVALSGAVINQGSTAAENVSMRLTLPPGLSFVSVTGSGPGGVTAACSGTQLVVCVWSGSTAPGVGLRLQAALTVNATALPDTAFAVDVSVESNTPDPAPANNSVTATVRTFGLQSDINLQASLPDGVVAGAPFPVRLVVANNGPDASSAAGTLQLPPGVSFVSGECGATLQGGTVRWQTGSLAAGGIRPCTLRLTLASAACSVADIAVSVVGVNHDPAPGNNVALLTNATVNLVGDPGFELQDNMTWGEESVVFPNDIICSAACGDGGGTAGPRTGTSFVWFGGTSNAETAAVTQSLTIPTSARTLTFWNMLGTCSPAGELDQLRLLIDGVERWRDDATATRCDDPPYHAPVVIPLGSFANGAAHGLRFAFSKAALGITNFSLDDVAIGTAPACSLPPLIFAHGFED
jgi:uncharacterized repeat protein (TIGR01451 family)